MTIYSLQVITTAGYPYYNLEIQSQPEGIPLYMRFYDFSAATEHVVGDLTPEESFDLTSGFISAIFEFSKNLERKLSQLEYVPLSKETASSLAKQVDPHRIKGNVLITLQTEMYLNENSVKQKIQMVYEWIIQNKIPLGSEKPILPEEKERIIEILTDAQARKIIEDKKEETRLTCENFLNEMRDYGLEGICIASFDLSPIITFGIDFDAVGELLRNVGKIPEVDTLEWKYRQSNIEDQRKWVYIVNSGVGPSEESIFMPFYYILTASPESFLGESPGILAQKLNPILG